MTMNTVPDTFCRHQQNGFAPESHTVAICDSVKDHLPDVRKLILLPAALPRLNVADDPAMGGTPGQFDLFHWLNEANEQAAQVSARRSFAGQLLFGRKLKGFALQKVYGYEQLLKARARAEFLWDRAERDRLEALEAQP
jgi:hypothetical protein